MSGTHQAYVETAFVGSSVCLRERESLERGLSFSLSSQYVYSRDLGQLFQVRRGSGMGTPHSGATSDKALMVLGEIDWAVRDDVMQQLDLRSWFRVKVDICVVIGGTTETRRAYFCTFFDGVSNCWDVELESIGSTANMLDLPLSIETRADNSVYIRYFPYSKPTHRPLPLIHTSIHPSSVHQWPLARTSRL